MPKKATDGGKRYPLNMRTTKQIRDRLEDAANANGRSLAHEVETRLEKSFDRDALLPDALQMQFGPELAGILLMIGKAMSHAGRSGAFQATYDLSPWFENPYGYDQAVKAANTILQALRPAGEIKVPAPKFENGMIGEFTVKEYFENYGRMFASSVVRDAVNGRAANRSERFLVDHIHRLVGDLVAERIADDFSDPDDEDNSG